MARKGGSSAKKEAAEKCLSGTGLENWQKNARYSADFASAALVKSQSW
jgi:hypothetical protein